MPIPIRADHPYVLAVGGFDPCGGAGILADAKTINALRAHGLTVMTANTLQHENAYMATHWIDRAIVCEQAELLLARYPIAAMKVGMLPHPALLSELRELLHRYHPDAPIVVDPVARSTASDHSLRANEQADWDAAWQGITLLTPNLQEYRDLYGQLDPHTLAQRLGIALLLKGGHAQHIADHVADRLYHQGRVYTLSVPRQPVGKHGTGCILSSAIATGLAHGLDLHHACANAQRYVADYMATSTTLLGLHAQAPSH